MSPAKLSPINSQIQDTDDNQPLEPRAAAGPNPKERGRLIAAALFCILLFVVLVSRGTIGLRGSDQYWYTGEVEDILRGHINQANVVFPFHAVRNLVPPPFNHHTLVHYMVLPFAKVLGAYGGWIVFNVLSTILSACLLAMLVYRVRGQRAALFALVIGLFMPLTFWVTSQPYLETSLSVYAVLGLFLYISMENSLKKWLLLLGLFVFAYCCRMSFLPMLLAVPVGYLLHAGRLRLSTVLTTIVMFAVIAGSIATYRHVFQPDPALTLSRYLNSKVPGYSDNSHLLYSTGEMHIEPWMVWRKMLAGIKEQFVVKPIQAQLFYLPFNIMALLSLLFCFTARKGAEQRAALGIVAIFALHFITVCLRGNELRFLMIANPAVLLGSCMYLGRFPKLWNGRVFNVGLPLILLALVAANVPLVLSLRRDVAVDLERKTALAATFDAAVAQDETVIVDSRPQFFEPDMLLGYVLRPRLALFLKGNYNYSLAELETMKVNTKAKWLFARPGSTLLTSIRGVDPVPVVEHFPVPFDDRVLYRISADSGALQ